MFKDRKDAGQKLGRALKDYKDQGVLVLGIPRGGAEVAYQVAKHLNADFSILVARKLPLPHNPEAGFGAIAEDGSAVILERARRGITQQVSDALIEEQRREIKRRVAVLRGGEPLPKIEGRTVILVDDGIAMGSTMRASIQLCKERDAEKIVVAVPVSGKRVAKQIEEMVEDIVVLEQPPYFRAVAQVYQNWYDVPDREVLDIMRRWEVRAGEAHG